MVMRLARFILPLLLLASPALAIDRFVSTTGGPVSGPTFCDGTQPQTLAQAKTNQDCSGPGGITGTCPCYYSTLEQCAAGTLTQPALVAGETCHVAAGRYSQGAAVVPKNSGSSAASVIRFVCDTDAVENYISTESNRCTIQSGSSGIIMDLRGKSYVEMDGFTVEPPDSGTIWEIALWGVGQSGTVDCDPVGGTSNCSQGVVWNHLKTRDLGPGNPPYLRVRGWGGGRVAGNTIKNSWLQSPYWGSTEAVPGFFFLGYSTGTAAAQETNTSVQNTFLFGGRNVLTITDSKDLVFDKGGSFAGKNHETDWCNQSVSGCQNITFKNWVFGGPAEFREPVPQVLGNLSNLTILNSVITGAWQFPFDSHDCQLTGTLTLRNNIILNLDSGKSKTAADMSAGCTGSGCSNGTCASTVLTNSIDYNAYIFTNDTVSSNQFRDSRNKTCTGTPLSHVCTTGVDFAGTNIAGWRAQTGADANSVVYLSKDWDSSATTVSGVTPARIFGNSAPIWYSPDVANVGGSGNPNIRMFSSADGWLTDVKADNATLASNPYFFEYDLDGTLRQLTTIVTTANTSALCTTSPYCNYDLTFTPMIDHDGDGTFDAATSTAYGDKPTGDRWAFWYGRQRDVNADGTDDFVSGQVMPHLNNHVWALASTSPLIDIGDPATCGHTALDGDGTGGARCDIGPVEYDGLPPPTGNLDITIDDLAITEGDAGTTTVTFTAHQSDSSTSATNFSWATSAVTATAGGACAGVVDYVTVAGGSGSFASGGTGAKTTTVGPITICGDALFESPETFSVTLSGATNATDTVVLVDPVASGVMGNDDPPPTFSTAGATVAESAGAVTNTPTISAAAGTVITLTYTVTSGSATVGTSCSTGVDIFATASGTLSWTVGSTTPTAGIVLTICDDSVINEGTETFNITWTASTPTGMVTPAAIVYSITDNDVIGASGATTIRGATLRGGSVNGGQSGVATRALGVANGTTLFAAGSPNCPASTTYQCAVVTITGCPEVAATATARLYVKQKLSTATALGTLAFFTGARGTGLWEAQLAPNNANAITTLSNLGYRSLQAVWDNPGWLSDTTSADYATSEKALACRTATLIKFIDDNYTLNSTLCAIGNSGGSQSIADSLSQYGSYTKIDAAYLGSGPTGTRIDLGCTQAPLTGGTTCESVYGYPETATAGKTVINESFGDPDSDADGTGDCQEGDDGTVTAIALAAWRQSSLGYASTTCPDTGTFYFPNTYISMVTGSLDSPLTCSCSPSENCGNAPAHADLYHDELDNTIAGRAGATTCHATQTQLEQNVITGVGHTLNGNALGITNGSATGWQDWVYTAGAPNRCKVYP